MKTFTLFSKYLCSLALFLISYSAQSQNSWNTAAVFDGSSYFSTVNSLLNAVSGEMTVEFWIKLDTSKGDYSIIGKQQFRIMTAANKIRVQVNGSSLLYSTSTIDSGKWTHIAVTFSNTNNTIRIYFNANLDNSYTTFTGTLAATSDSLFIGKSNYAENLVGELDEVRIWKTVRSSAEIQNNYKTHLGWYGSNFYDNNLVFCQTYDFDVYSPGIYFPSGFTHGIITGDLLGDKPSNTVLHNNSMFFSGSSYLEASSSNDPNISLTGTMTVEAWIYPVSIGTTQTILDLTGGGSGGYKLVLESSGKISWTMNQKGTGNIILSPNNWYHVAVVCSTPSSGYQVAYIYINGKLDAGYNFNELAVNTGKLRIGVSQSDNNYFSGYIDEIRISNFAKSQPEIQRYLHTPILYANKPAAPKSTVAYNFDGNLYSGTRIGSILQNHGCRFSYASESYSPLFHSGGTHESSLDSLKTRHPFKPIPQTGTAGYTFDTLQIDKSIALDENKFKIFISLNHNRTSDLRLELFSPGGDSVVLFNQVLKSTKGFTCMLDNQPDNLISGSYTDVAPVVGSIEPFSVFNGKNSAGPWILKITDFVNGNTGILNGWGLLLDGVPYVSLPESTDDNSILVYPNPSAGRQITIHSELLKSSPCNVQVMNLAGQILYEKTEEATPNIYINMPENIPAGSFIVIVTNESGRFHFKLVLN